MADEIKLSELDKLFKLIAEYRESENYRALLKYISNFKNLSPYNAFLVVQQRPGSQYVLTPDEWKREGRDIRLNARPLVILRPFGPVQFVYDVSDTVMAGDSERTLFDDIEDVVERLSAPYRTYGAVPEKELDRLLNNARIYGIQSVCMLAGAAYAAKIEYLDDQTSKRVLNLTFWVKDRTVSIPANHLISFRGGAECGEAFASCCHELGHLFCGHIRLPDWMPAQTSRSLSHAAEEFEAESVAWLVCRHFEVDNPSEAYLVNYCDRNKMIPDGVSVERIFFAANQITRMSSQSLQLKEGWLYKHNEKFREQVKKLNKKNDNGQ